MAETEADRIIAAKALGGLENEIKETKERLSRHEAWAGERWRDTSDQFKDMRASIDKLLSGQNKIMGGIAFVSVIMPALAALVAIYFAPGR